MYRIRSRQRLRRVLDTVAESLSKRGAEVSQELVSGPTAGMIEKVAKDENFSFTALAPGAHSKVEQFFLGSTTLKVAKRCPGMVLVLRNSHDTNQLDTVVFGLDGSDNAKTAMVDAIETFKLGRTRREDCPLQYCIRADRAHLRISSGIHRCY